ncbi:MAG: hypothetical protein CO031_02495 [Candidatus Nealsonbacteria bacterium CG_4_9_14_0_2_um_filter_37_38]|nr:MAG: hypothetical protein COV63_02985 [Candidatus Nealsonbacteria bacterium CG11_big_fil_rev_8_21_14_0_20_37_68]PIW91892.1 MAG: hypothetical protein COZ89_02745 [Candidatus Nealsonbacteria bacterium CG_4_8_14_3_um_filter_37_23]PJC51497.1 MAG: hypothetical protein CO031_02495 [Candidatus Nealsonbacteria bacterium CG_4_9_14_0_2_um_filter_37_38]
MKYSKKEGGGMKRILEKHGVKPEYVKWIDKPIERDFIRLLIEEIDKLLPTTEIFGFIITSGGGNPDQSLSLVDYIRTNRIRVITLALGAVGSAAIDILELGEKRLMTKNSSLMLHEGVTSQEKDTLTNVASYAKYIEMIRNVRFKLWAKRTGKPLKTLLQDCRLDRYFTAQEAKEYGLIDEVI